MLDSEKLEEIRKNIEEVVNRAERDTGLRIAALTINRDPAGQATVALRFDLESVTLNIGS